MSERRSGPESLDQSLRKWRRAAISLFYCLLCLVAIIGGYSWWSWRHSLELAGAVERMHTLAQATEEERRELVAQLAVATLPDVPVSVRWRAAAFDASRVLVLRSFADLPLRVAITPEGGEPLARSLPVDAILELGHREGVPFLSGQRVVISADGFRQRSVIVE
jgi:hypothetical protein